MIFGRTLLDNDSYLLRVGVFGRSGSLFIKRRNLTIKAAPEEVQYLVDLSAELEKRGVSVAPGSADFELVCDLFCGAVATRPGIRWRAFFRGTPDQKAAELLKPSDTKS
jgi:hypothetical protein